MAEVEQQGAGTTGDERLTMIRTVTDLNNAFHRSIQTASRNIRLETILRSIVSVPLVFQSFYWYSDRELAESLTEQREIIAALTERDGARAETLMQRHITRGLNTLLREVRRA
jgi:DNA-binding GntR family transcriptional regulator